MYDGIECVITYKIGDRYDIRSIYNDKVYIDVLECFLSEQYHFKFERGEILYAGEYDKIVKIEDRYIHDWKEIYLVSYINNDGLANTYLEICHDNLYYKKEDL